MNDNPFKFVKHDPQRFVVGSLANQIKVLLQRMQMRGFKPWKILLNPGLRYALELEGHDYVKRDLGHFFMGLLIQIDVTVSEPIILIKPELVRKQDESHSTHGKRGSYASR